MIIEREWQFDRRISIGHIVSFFVMAGMLLGVYIQMSGRILLNEARIANLERRADRQEQQIADKLESISAKLDAHFTLHLTEAKEERAK